MTLVLTEIEPKATRTFSRGCGFPIPGVEKKINASRNIADRYRNAPKAPSPLTGEDRGEGILSRKRRENNRLVNCPKRFIEFRWVLTLSAWPAAAWLGSLL